MTGRMNIQRVDYRRGLLHLDGVPGLGVDLVEEGMDAHHGATEPRPEFNIYKEKL